MNVGILLFDGVQLTDFTGPFDVFSAARPAGATLQSEPLFRVFTLSLAEELRCAGGLVVRPEYRLSDHPPIELLVVPGGMGTRREETTRS